MFHLHRSYEDGTDKVFRKVVTKFRRGGITQKKEYKRTLAGNHGFFKSRSIVINQED